MNNEELAVRIQAGESFFYDELWEQVRRLIAQRMNCFYRLHASTCDRAGVTIDDLMQCGFLALYDAVQAYKPDEGYKLITYLSYPLKTHINEALGIRTKKRHPLNECTSLDLPIGENESDGMTIADTVPDPSAEQAIEDAEQRAYIEKLHADLDLCLSMIPEECAEVVRGRYYEGRTLDDIATERGNAREWVRQLERRGLNRLRHGKSIRVLRDYKEEYISTHAYKGTGLTAWKNNGSAPEIIVEKLEHVQTSA